jgi:hypothetical protein
MAGEEFSLGSKEVQQTILVLNLSVAQIDLSITDGDNSVDTLIESFTYMSQHIEKIQASSSKMAALAGDSAQAVQSELQSEASELADKMSQAIVAFQFYDKLSQRLQHVSHGISGLAEIVSHKMRVKDAAEWEAFKADVRQGTTMREEEELFELVFDQNLPVDKAISIMKERIKQRMHETEEVEDEFEFF